MSDFISKKLSPSFVQVYEWSNLILAWKKASKGKRGGQSAAEFEYQLADNLLELQTELMIETYEPSGYVNFYIHEPKRRQISAAPFRDRVVHHALCNIIEPVFERRFIPDSYANRVGKGTHKAINRLQYFTQCYPYALQLDIVKHFPSLDHAILFENLQRCISDEQILQLIKIIIDSGKGIHQEHGNDFLFPNDDLLDLCRPKGLPIGNLTSQFWSNCYLHSLDLFIKRELSCKAYLRYVDDFVLLSHSKSQLWEWKEKIREKLYSLRLRFHESSAQVTTVKHGVPWLGFVVYPDYRRLKRRKVLFARKKLNYTYQLWQEGKMSFEEFDASLQGWINHVRYADTWGLRRDILKDFKR